MKTTLKNTLLFLSMLLVATTGCKKENITPPVLNTTTDVNRQIAFIADLKSDHFSHATITALLEGELLTLTATDNRTGSVISFTGVPLNQGFFACNSMQCEESYSAVSSQDIAPILSRIKENTTGNFANVCLTTIDFNGNKISGNLSFGLINKAGKQISATIPFTNLTIHYIN